MTRGRWAAKRGGASRAGGALVAALAALLVIGAPSVVSADITLRSGQRINEPIEVVSIEGITVRGTVTRIIGWETIADVTGPHAGSAEHFMPMADLAWRAKIRLDRGDLRLAQPILEELFVQLQHSDGSAALLAAEGLMRSRLAGADLPGAMRPWLQAARHRHAGTMMQGEDRATGLLDQATLLCASLPPFLTPEQAREALAQLSAEPMRLPSGPASELMAWYRLAAQHDSGIRPSDAPSLRSESVSQHPGIRFTSDLVMARLAGSEQERSFYRNRLRLGLESDLNTWREAWRRAGIGLSYLLESDEDSVMLGVLELLHIPARFGTTQPQLAGLAMAHAAAGLDRLGYETQALKLRDELRSRYPGHPALAMLPSEAAKDEAVPFETQPLDSIGAGDGLMESPLGWDQQSADRGLDGCDAETMLHQELHQEIRRSRGLSRWDM